MKIFKKKNEQYENIVQSNNKPLIDISKLKIGYTYCGIEVGTSTIAKIIQKLEHKVYKNIEANKLGSHAFILRYKDGEFYVVENHFCWKGVKEYKLSEYLEINKKSTDKIIEIYEHSFNNFALDYYSSKYGNPGYSLTDLANIAEERLVGIKLPDDNAMICSSLVAMADSFFFITSFFKMPAHQITPADIQHYFKVLNIENINKC